MVKSYQDLKEKTLAMTAFFETSNTYPECYGITAGNWDFQGLSHGVLQYNFGTGSLQPLWIFLNTNHNQLCRDVFGADYQEWADVLGKTEEEQVAWGDLISDSGTGKHTCIQPWKDYFMTLGTSQASIDKQIDMSQAWRANAEKWFANLGLYSRRGFALLWDISVQMGRLLPLNLIWDDFQNLDRIGKTKEQIEIEKLYLIVERCSFEENKVTDAGIQSIVYNRKKAIVDGTSQVGFNIAQYDLDYDPAFKGAIKIG